ncbi:MAG: pyruvate ferredoxin oxidoreductase [Prevotella sp.]|nr:pyruvate ferredoxin oxidoreductase [Prevotella sp.]
MDYKYIEQLLNRYFEAETTLKEEQILSAFFAQDDEDVPSALRRYKPLFEAMEKGDVLGADFDDRMLRLIDGQTDADTPQEARARVISLQERFRPLLRAAAVVAVILTMSTAINQSFRDDNVWTDDEQIAHYQDEIRKAAIAAATADSIHLYSEGIDTTYLAPTGYLE